jgi:hypothetical protein
MSKKLIWGYSFSRGEGSKSELLSAAADSLRDKVPEAQRHKAERPFGYIRFSLCTFVPLQLCACIRRKNQTEVFA